MNSTTHSPEFWQKFYDDQSVPWDQNQVSQGIKSYFEDNFDELKRTINKVIVPGCGQGHEVAYINSIGFDAIGIDWASGAIELAQKRYPKLDDKFIQCDFFNLPNALIGQFDLVCEYTFFVAIPPELRNNYLVQVKKLLKPKGFLLGGFMLKNKADERPGPPHRLNPKEIIDYLENHQITILSNQILNADSRLEEIILAQI